MDDTKNPLKEGANLFGIASNALSFRVRATGAAYLCLLDGRRVMLELTPTFLLVGETIDMLEQKLDFVNYLGENGVSVRRSLPSKHDRLVEVVETGKATYAVSLREEALGWRISVLNVSDRFWNEALFLRWGRVMGRIHALSKRYGTWESRPQQSLPGELQKEPHESSDDGEPYDLFRDWRWYQDLLASWCTDALILEKLLELAEELSKLPKTRKSHGLIHGDLGPGNFLINNDGLTVVGFDFCSHSWLVDDVAGALYHAMRVGPTDLRLSAQGFATSFLGQFMAGYSLENTLGTYWLKQLPTFLKYRTVGGYIRRAKDSRTDGPIGKLKEIPLKELRHRIVNDLPYVDLDL